MTTIRLRGGTAAQWTTANSVLASREVGVETDTGQLKVGDGSSAWTALPYAGAGGSSLTTEQVQDIVGAMVSGGAETGVAVTYDDTNGRFDFVAEVTQDELDSAVSTHASDTTSVHGIADTTVLATDAEVASAVSTHAGSGHLTNEDVDDRVASLLVAGTNVTLTYNDGANTLTIDATGGGGGGLTQEQAEDIVAALIDDNSDLDWTYDDASASLVAVIKSGAVTSAMLALPVALVDTPADDPVLTSKVTGEAFPRFRINVDGTLFWEDGASDPGSSNAYLYLVEEGRIGTWNLAVENDLDVAGQLTLGNALVFTGETGGDLAETLYVEGDTQPRFQEHADGQLKWGPGGATTPDTNLYRSAANTLKTDDSLVIEGDLSVTGNMNIADGDIPSGIARDSEVTSAISTHASGNGHLTTEEVQDLVGGMVSGGTETGIAVTYDDTNARLDFVAEVTQAELDAHAADTTSIHGITDTANLVDSTTVNTLVVLTQAAYNGLTPDANTLYFING